MRLYLDSSAVVKLVQRERETTALRRFLRAHAADTLVTCALARVEVVRAVFDGGSAAVAAARRQLGRLHEVVLSESLLDDAGTLGPSLLRSLDAIHLCAARRLGAELRAVVTYDRRLADAAHRLRIPVASPGNVSLA